MDSSYLYFPDLSQAISFPTDGTLSRTLLNNDSIKVVLFGFDSDQELSEHTASMPAILQFVSGEAAVKLADDWVQARPGSFVYMPAGLNHAIRTKTPVVMLLVLLKSAAPSIAGPDRGATSPKGEQRPTNATS